MRASVDGSCVATGSEGSTVRVWDVGRPETVATLPGDAGADVAISADGTRVVTVSRSGPSAGRRVWGWRTSKRLAEWPGDPTHLLNVAVSADATQIVAGGSDGLLRVWDTGTRKVSECKGHSGTAGSVAVSEDGTRAVTAAPDGSVRVWDIRAGRQPPELIGHSVQVTRVAVSEDGGRIVTGSRDGTARVWSARTGLTEAVLRHETGPVECVATSKDGRIVATGSRNVVSIWHPSTGRVLAWHTQHGNSNVRDVQVSQDGKLVTSRSADNRERAVDADDRALIGTAFPRSAGELEWHKDRPWKMVGAGKRPILIEKGPDGDTPSFFERHGLAANVRRDRLEVFEHWQADFPFATLQRGGAELTAFAAVTDRSRLLTATTAKLIRIWDSPTSQVAAFWGEY